MTLDEAKEVCQIVACEQKLSLSTPMEKDVILCMNNSQLIIIEPAILTCGKNLIVVNNKLLYSFME